MQLKIYVLCITVAQLENKSMYRTCIRTLFYNMALQKYAYLGSNYIEGAIRERRSYNLEHTHTFISLVQLKKMMSTHNIIIMYYGMYITLCTCIELTAHTADTRK